MATIPLTSIVDTDQANMGAQFVVLGRLNANFADAYVAGGDILLAETLGLEQIDDVHFSNPGLRAGVAKCLVKYVRDADGINGKVQYFLATTGAEITLAADRADDIDFAAFGR
jgi:hypothetical protein